MNLRPFNNGYLFPVINQRTTSMVKRRHYLTSIFVLLLPVIVIYALTSYDTQTANGEQETTIEIPAKTKQHCQKKTAHQKESFS
ncbi:MAG: hypothetical protein AB3N14_13955 [Flavobacteriaceae bacterium]